MNQTGGRFPCVILLQKMLYAHSCLGLHAGRYKGLIHKMLQILLRKGISCPPSCWSGDPACKMSAERIADVAFRSGDPGSLRHLAEEERPRIKPQGVQPACAAESIRQTAIRQPGVPPAVVRQTVRIQLFRGALALAIFFRVAFVPRSMNTSSFLVA